MFCEEMMKFLSKVRPFHGGLALNSRRIVDCDRLSRELYMHSRKWTRPDGNNLDITNFYLIAVKGFFFA